MPCRAGCVASRDAGNRQRGAALLEFALVALVLYGLLGAVVEFGRLMFMAQVAQSAASTAARELALAPLSAVATFADALDDPQVRATIYDKDLLVIDLAALPPGVSIQDVAGLLPLVNRALLPLMISDTVDVGGTHAILRFPGAMVVSDLANGVPALNPTGLTVRVPRVLARDADGIESIDWVDVIEEIRVDPADPTTGAFSVDSGLAADPATAALAGVVAVRVNVPFQAALLSAFQPGAGGPFEPNGNNPVLADDAAVALVGPDPGTLVEGSNLTYAGPYGLGKQFALGKEVRPFRRVIAAQAVFRREVFAEQSP